MLPFQRFWTRTALPLVCAGALVTMPGCRSAKPVESQGVVPELKLEGVRFRVYRGDDLRAFGDAATVTFRRDSTDLTAHDVVAPGRRDAAGRAEHPRGRHAGGLGGGDPDGLGGARQDRRHVARREVGRVAPERHDRRVPERTQVVAAVDAELDPLELELRHQPLALHGLGREASRRGDER